jgi:hypothetical protein
MENSTSDRPEMKKDHFQMKNKKGVSLRALTPSLKLLHQ